MKTTFKILSAFIIAFGLTLTSCKKDPVDDNPGSTTKYGKVTIEFENMVGDSAFVFNTKNYINHNGDTFTISKYKYYISNIKLTSSSGTYVESESYHLVDQSVSGSLSFDLNNVPEGNYTGLTFTIGVDSARNVSGAQTGALDPANGMFWSWSTGYIMAKLEGTSPQSPEVGNIIMYHVGGFSGVNNVLKTVSPSFGGATANVTETHTPEIHIVSDISEWFKSPNLISIATGAKVHMPNAMAKSIADNYADMFMVKEIHN